MSGKRICIEIHVRLGIQVFCSIALLDPEDESTRYFETSGGTRPATQLPITEKLNIQ